VKLPKEVQIFLDQRAHGITFTGMKECRRMGVWGAGLDRTLEDDFQKKVVGKAGR